MREGDGGGEGADEQREREAWRSTGLPGDEGGGRGGGAVRAEVWGHTAMEALYGSFLM